MKKTIGLIVAMDKELSLFVDNNPSVSIESKCGCFDFLSRPLIVSPYQEYGCFAFLSLVCSLE